MEGEALVDRNPGDLRALEEVIITGTVESDNYCWGRGKAERPGGVNHKRK